MTATARSNARCLRGVASRKILGGSLVALVASATPACAQVAASAGVESAYRFRGHDLSGRRPVVTVDVSYDDKSGVYLGGSAIVLLTGTDPGLMELQGDIGLARPIDGNLSYDIGITRSQYFKRNGVTRNVHYTEFYAGLSRRNLSVHVYYSPDYLAPGVNTLYGDATLTVRPAKFWSLTAHAGKMFYLANRPPQISRFGYYDWSLGVGRQLGRFEAHLTLSGGGPGRDYYSNGFHDRTAVTGGINVAF